MKINDNDILLTDSRDLAFPARSVFFALSTSGNDGHLYIPKLYAQGVKKFVVRENFDDSLYSEAEFEKVPSVLEALQAIAARRRQQMDPPVVIGITGSAGKTVVKEMLAQLLREERVLAVSPRSYNSQIGVPLSVWQLQPDTQVAIIEAGISLPGEMANLQAIIRPNIGVFVSLTGEHDADFESRQHKAREKARLFVQCSDVFFPSAEELIAEAVRLECPQATLHPVDGGNKELAVAVADFVTGSPHYTAGLKPLASTRIDVLPTLKNCLLVYDNYHSYNGTEDLKYALGYARRQVGPGRTLTAILPKGYADAASLQAYGVQRLLEIDLESNDAAVEDFLQRYSMSDFQDEVVLIKGPEPFADIRSTLEAPRHETVMEVDLGAVTRNFNYYRSLLPAGTGLVAMVKAAGYGVGSKELARTLQNQGAAYLAVAVIDEGTELRRSGITMPIMVMNPITINYRALFEHRLEPSVFSLREFDLLLDAAQMMGAENYPIHIKLDTGMHRLGFLESELDELLERVNGQTHLRVESIFSHLATADCLDQDEYTESQLQAFERMSQRLLQGLKHPARRHILNTAGMMRYPEYAYDMARLGIGLYGISPLSSASDEHLEVVARLYSTIISIKEWGEGTTIGYGRRGVLQGPALIATVPIGYADGLDRHLSCGGATFMVNGVECPIVGNICMDQCMIDVTGANAQIGDKVEIFGDNLPLQRLSDKLGTIPYEILTSISPRVKRIYTRE